MIYLQGTVFPEDDIIDFSNYYNEIKESLLTAQMLKKEVSIYVLGENSK